MPSNFWQELWDIFRGPLTQVVGAVALCVVAWLGFKTQAFLKARKALTDSERGNDAARDAVARVEREYVAPLKDPTTPAPFDEAAKLEARRRAAAIVVERVPEMSPAVAADKVERAVAEMQSTGAISAALPTGAVKTPSNPPAAPTNAPTEPTS